MKMNKNTISALLALLMAPGLVSAGSLEELEALSASSPEDYGLAYDNSSRAPGLPQGNGQISQQELKRLMISDLDTLRNIMFTEYAPAGWKAQQYGWDLDAEIRKAKEEIGASDSFTIKEYQQVVRRIMNSARDYHVEAHFNSAEEASLPLGISEAEGRYFITSIDRKALPESSFPFREGDELTAFDGKPMQEAVAEMARQKGLDNTPHTDRGLLAQMFFSRTAFLGDSVPQGPARLSIRPAGAAGATEVTLNWDYTPDLISQQPFVTKSAAAGLPLDWTTFMMADPAGASGSHNAGYGIGDRDGFLPDLGEKIWESKNTPNFRAYIYLSPASGRKTGYVRIPTYHISDPAGNVAEFRSIIEEFNRREAEALVIDQLNNPGGYVLYMYALASMLTEKPLLQPQYRVTLTQADALSAAATLGRSAAVKTDADAVKFFGGKTNLAGYPVDYSYFSSRMSSLRSYVANWQEGKVLTDPDYLDGLKYVQPHKTTRFAGPILLLINELDISCGDFFPAMLQDNGRAVLFGERTSGAGGSVQQVNYPPNLLGIRELKITGSIAVRPDGTPLENLGTSPDIPYGLTANDIQGGFRGYLAAVDAALSGLVR